VVLLEDDKEVSVRVNRHFAGRVSCLKHLLSELLAQILNLQDPERVLTDGDETFRALGGTKWASRLKSFIADRGDAMLAHEAIAEPGLV